MTIEFLKAPTSYNKVKNTLNPLLTSLLNAVAGEGTVDATDPVVTALLTSESGSRAAVEGIIDDNGDSVVADALDGGAQTNVVLDSKVVTLARVGETVADEVSRTGSAALNLLRVPTIEESAQTVILSTDTITGGVTTIPVFTALYTCSLDQAALAVAENVTADASNWWRVTLTSYRNGVPTQVVSKHTGPSTGEGFTAFKGWTFDLNTFNAEARILNKGDVLAVTIEVAGGTPDPLEAPVLTFRVTPVDVGVEPPEPSTILVADNFNRPDNASLGTSSSGTAWTNSSGWGITSNQAQSTGVGLAAIDAGESDCTIEAKIVSHGSGSTGIVFRYTDASNYYGITNNQVFKRVGGALTYLSPNLSAPNFGAGDTARVVLAGSSIKVYNDDGSTGTFVEIGSYTDSFNQTATLHGLRASASGAQVDSFEVTA